jgi:DNA polymerase III epsilon subunit-like protein
MIVVDIETSGGDFEKCAVWQIGAVELENPKNTFLEEARMDEEDQIVNSINLPDPKPVLEVIGKTEEELRDKKKQSQKQLIQNFLNWCSKIKKQNFICHNPQFDYGFIWTKANKYGLKFLVPHRCFDLHSFAAQKYFWLHGKFLEKENRSDMGLKNILSLVGMQDNRGIHNALEDARLTAEAFYRLVYGKNLLEEYSQFPVPDYIIKGNNIRKGVVSGKP